MTLTRKQAVAITNAKGEAKNNLREFFKRQQQQQSGGKIQRLPSRLTTMPRAQPTAPGIMPVVARRETWSQTPASSNVVAPRGFGYYDAFSNDAYTGATHMSIGPATPIEANTMCNGIMTRAHDSMQVIGLGTYEVGMKLLVVYPSASATQAMLFTCSTDEHGEVNAQDSCTGQEFNSPNLMSSPPDNAIPTRCSMRIRNWTQSVGTGGIVRVLRCTTGLSLGLSDLTTTPNTERTTNVALAVLCDEIRNHARTRVYSGSELCEMHQKNCSVVDQSKSTWFTDWNTQTPIDQVPWAKPVYGNVLGNWDHGDLSNFTLQLHDPAYTPICVLFEPFIAAVNGANVGNSYEVSIRSQFLAHYPQGTMLANMAFSPEHAPAKIEQARAKEESQGSMLANVAHAVRDAASWVWQHRGPIVAAGKAIRNYAPRALPMLMS
jgi:hypothetical protein